MESATSPVGTTWQVRIGCDDCTGIDFTGCFEGGWAQLMTDDEGYFIAPVGDGAAATFATEDEAEAALDEVQMAGPWGYELVRS